MSDRCERCRKGYTSPLPRDDLEWPDERPEPWRPGLRELRVARCTRCDSWLLDLWTTDADKHGVESHDVCVVKHDSARAALLHRDPLALAQVADSIRRRHLEMIIARMPTVDEATLHRIEAGTIETSDAFRGLVTWVMASRGEHPVLSDLRGHGLRAAPTPARTTGLRVPLEVGDGSRVMLEPRGTKLSLVRMRGDAVAWRTELDVDTREAFVGQVAGSRRPTLIVLAAGSDGRAAVCVVDAIEGQAQGPVWHDLRVATFEARALPGDCIFVASYQASAVIRHDATAAWKGSTAGFPIAVDLEAGAIVTDAAWRLVSVQLPSGTERWSMPLDRSATIVASGPCHVLISTTDAVARFEISGNRPRLVWLAAGGPVLPLADGGAALVRERWDRAGRTIECLVLAPDGRRRYVLSRPNATKVPTVELAPTVLMFHAGSDVVVTAGASVTYALSLPDRKTPSVTVTPDGVWLEYGGIVDHVDLTGYRTGRWRVG